MPTIAERRKRFQRADAPSNIGQLGAVRRTPAATNTTPSNRVTPTYGTTGGIASAARVAQNRADYAARGLDANGNNQTAIAQLTARADKMEADRLGRAERRHAFREANSQDAARSHALAQIQRASFSDVPDDQRAAALARETLGSIGQTSALGNIAQANQAERNQQARSIAELGQQGQQFGQQQQLARDELAQRGAQFDVEQETERLGQQAQYDYRTATQQQQQDQFDQQQQLARDRMDQQVALAEQGQQSQQQGGIASIAANAYQAGISDYNKRLEDLKLNPEALAAFQQQFPTAGDYASRIAEGATNQARSQTASPEARRLLAQNPDATLDEIEAFLASRKQQR